jgi:hypothetical protein
LLKTPRGDLSGGLGSSYIGSFVLEREFGGSFPNTHHTVRLFPTRSNKRTRRNESEDARLKRIVAELELDKQILKESLDYLKPKA